MDPVQAAQARLSELVGSIYEAGMEPERWRSVLESATLFLGSAVGMLWTHDFSTNSIHLPNAQLSCMVGLDDAGVREFKSYYYSRNVWVPRSKFVREGSTVLSSHLYPEAKLPATEFYTDWLRPMDLYFAIGSAVLKEATRDVKLSFVRSRQAGPFSEDERRRVAFLLPHVRNAFLLHRRLGNVQALADSACAALDRLSIGVVLLAKDGSVLHANEAARKAAARTRALTLAEPLGCAMASETIRLRKLLAEAVLTGAGTGLRSGGAMKVRGLAGEMHVTVTPLPATNKALAGTASAVMFCTVPGEPPRELIPLLCTVHGLTPAEAALAAALVEGLSLKEVAQRRNISLNTVRTQLKSICHKTGTRRQADLVRVLAASLPLLGAA
jgi:DNA-binding CsgD family transcriptional regulator